MVHNFSHNPERQAGRLGMGGMGMSREIKFRAWDKNKKRMKTGKNNYVRFDGSCHIHTKDPWDDCISQENIVLMQYTGLKDKNGREIFEGDIVKWDDRSDGRYWRVCEVKWEPSHYLLEGYWYKSDKPEVKTPVRFKFGAFIYENDGELEVIGNIHENPELLEGKQ